MSSTLPLLLGLACSPQPAPEAQDPARDTLVIGIPADVSTMVAGFSRSALDVYVNSALTLPPVQTRFEGRLVASPGLARSWSWSDDGLVLHLELRDDNHWSDGQPVTAHDLAFTYDLLADPATASPYVTDLAGLAPGEVQATDDTHLSLRFATPGPRETRLLQVGIIDPLPRHLLQDIPRDALHDHAFNRQPVLNGPWRLASWEPGQQIVLEPRAEGLGPAEQQPRLDRVVFRVVPEYTTRLVELQTGALDLVTDLRVDDALRLAQDHPSIGLHRRGWRKLCYVGWNMLDPLAWLALNEGLPPEQRADPAQAPPHPIFGDPSVRRALGQAIDVERIIQDLYSSPASGERWARPAVSNITPSLTELHASDIEPVGHDPTAARAALDSAGWSDSDGDGVRDRDGQPLQFRLLTRAGSDPRSQVALYLQDDLKAVGAAVDIEQAERASYYQRLSQRDFDAVLGGWSVALFPEPREVWHSAPESHYNFVSYANPRADRLIERSEDADDEAEEAEALRQLQRVIHQDQPYRFLYWSDEIVAAHSRFADVSVDITAPWRDLHRWRAVEAAEHARP